MGAFGMDVNAPAVAGAAAQGAKTEAMSGLSQQVNNNISATRNQISALDSKIASDQKKAKNAQKDMQKASGDISKAQKQLDSAKTDADRASAQQKLDAAQDKLGTAKVLYKQARGELKSDAKMMKNLQAQLADLIGNALPQAKLMSSVESKGKEAQNNTTSMTKDDAKSAGVQGKEALKSANEGVAKATQALADTAPQALDGTGEMPEDGTTAIKDVTADYKDGGEGQQNNMALITGDKSAQSPTAYMAAKTGTTDSAQSKTPTGDAAKSGFERGTGQPAAQTTKAVGDGSSLTMVSGEEPKAASTSKLAADAKTGDAAQLGTKTAAFAASPAATPVSASPSSPDAATGHASAMYAAAPAASDTGAGKSADAARVPATPDAGGKGVTTTRNDATGTARIAGLDHAQASDSKAAAAPGAGAAKGADSLTVTTPSQRKIDVQFDPASERLTVGSTSVPMTAQQWQNFKPALQTPQVQQGTADVLAAAQSNPQAFGAAMTNIAAATQSATLQTSSKLATPSSTQNDPAPSASAPAAAPAAKSAAPSASSATASASTPASTGGSASGKSTYSKELEKEIKQNFFDAGLDRLFGGGGGDDDKETGAKKSKSKMSGGVAGKGAVVGGGGAVSQGPQVMGLTAAGAGAGAAAAGSGTASTGSIRLAAPPTTSKAAAGTDGSSASNSTDGKSDANGQDTPVGDGNVSQSDEGGSIRNYSGAGLTGMELVQAVLLMASAESQADVRDMAEQVKAKTAMKADIRNALSAERSEQTAMQQADSKGGPNGNQWFSANGNGQLTDKAMQMNANMTTQSSNMEQIGDDNQLLFIKLQNLSQQLTQAMQAASGVSKSLFDTSKAIVGNIGH